jgi:hypothetical protein
MGYRSDVCMVIYGEHQYAMRELKALMDAAGIDLTKDWGDDRWGIDDEQFCFLTDDVKWYDSYPEVQAVMKVWQLAQDTGEDEDGLTRYSGIFLRIGEETSDIEQESFGDPWEHECPYVSRCFDTMRKFNLGKRLSVGTPA